MTNQLDSSLLQSNTEECWVHCPICQTTLKHNSSARRTIMPNAQLNRDDDILGIDTNSSSDNSILHGQRAFETFDQCRFRGSICCERRAIKPDGSLHRLCEAHRRHQSLMQRNKQQRQRLLQTLLNALQPESTDASSRDRTRYRPRLVFLGNQQTLVLGIVLSEHGGIGRVSRQAQRPQE